MDDQERSVRLGLESIRELIAAEEPDVEILSSDEAPGSGRGDNYCSMLYRAEVKGRKRRSSSEFESWKRSIIYKVLPESKERREAFKSEVLFRNEVVFYTKVWPALQDLQTKGSAVFDGVAKIYIAQDHLIAMEDLRARGYNMADRRKGLQVNKLKQVLKALAGFHALSLTLKEMRPEVFTSLSDPNAEPGESIQEAMFRPENADWYRPYYRTATQNALKMVTECLPPNLESRRDEILGKFRAFLAEERLFNTMCELTSAQGPLSVFCHGDCWTNNFLFKEDQAVCLVDFQLTRVGSLALDLANLLYLCTTAEIRKNYMTELLQHYHRHLMSSLYTLNPAAESTKDPASMWNLLTEEMHRCSRFGLGLAVDMLPISTCTSDQAPDVYEGKITPGEAAAGEDPELRGDPEDDVPLGAPPPPKAGAECARLMTDLVVELIDSRALS